MKFNTAAAKEKHLNALYFDAFTEEQTIDNFIYLTNKSRGKYISEKRLRTAYQNREIGTILRKYDPIAFNCAD